MDFGFVFFGNVNIAPTVALAEKRGFSHAWLYDSQMLTSDVYAALAFYFDAATVSRAMGYSYMFKLPLTFTLAPLAGALFEATGEYKVPFLLSSALTAAAAISFLYLSLRGTHQTTS